MASQTGQKVTCSRVHVLGAKRVQATRRAGETFRPLTRTD